MTSLLNFFHSSIVHFIPANSGWHVKVTNCDTVQHKISLVTAIYTVYLLPNS